MTNSTRSASNMLKSVRFDQVFIHEFPIIMGDNPAVSKGAPITIDWKPIAHDVLDLDIYEYLREPERRHRKRIIVSNSKRTKILMNSGYTVDDIAEMTMQVEDAKRVRAENALEAVNLSNNAWFKNINTNIMELLSGAAEGTGRTLFIDGPSAVLKGANKVGYEVVKGTGKATTAVVVGTGNLLATTGKVSADIAVGTVKGTGKVVVGAGKATTAVVVGTGKLGYGVVKSTGKRMSKLMTFNDSAREVLDADALGYADPDDAAALPFEEDVSSMGRSSSSTRDRRGSNEDRLWSNEIKEWQRISSKGTPAPRRMPRRGSSNGSVALQVASRTNSQLSDTVSPPEKNSKGKRRGSGNSALAGSFSNFTNIFTGRGVRRANSSSDKRGTSNLIRRTKSSDGNGGKRDRRRRATLTTGTPASLRLTKSANSTTALGGGFSDLAQMEQFLTYVRDSDATTVNPTINNAYNANQGSLGYNEDDPSNQDGFDGSDPGPRSSSTSTSAPEQPQPPNPSLLTEPVRTPAA